VDPVGGSVTGATQTLSVPASSPLQYAHTPAGLAGDVVETAPDRTYAQLCAPP
jgi:hypothetical protein